MSRNWARGWLWWFAHPSAGVECKEQTLYPALLGTKQSTLFLLQALQKWQLGFGSFLYLLSRICPNCACTVFCFLFFCFFVFHSGGQVCIFLLEDKFMQVQALQHCSKGSQVPQCLRMYHLFVCIVIFVSGLCYMKFLQVLFHLIFVFKKQS